MSVPKTSSYEYYAGKTASDVDYAEFIGQLALDDVSLQSASVRRLKGGPDSGLSDVILTDSVWWKGMNPDCFDSGKYIGDGFEVFHKYVAHALDKNRRKTARIEVEFSLYYLSLIPMDDETFEVFSETTVPLNTWPYLREYLDSTLGRLGLTGYTLPSRSSSKYEDYEVENSEPFVDE
jgi:hypothetical protein